VISSTTLRATDGGDCVVVVVVGSARTVAGTATAIATAAANSGANLTKLAI